MPARSIITPEITAEAAALFGKGLGRESVAAMLGLSKQTLYNWLKRGARALRRLKKGEGPDEAEAPFVAFLDAVKKGLAEGELKDLETIRLASATAWQAAAWRLERRFPGRWSGYRKEIRELLKLAKAMRKDRAAAATPMPLQEESLA